MTQDELIVMAKEAGLHIATDVNWMPIIGLEYAKKLVELAVAKEREACANLCDELQAPPHVSDDDMSMWDVTSMECANAIRARGEA